MTINNFWWSLPENVHTLIKSMVPDKDSWTLECKKFDDDTWKFSIPQFLTFNESFCGGTEKIIDYWVKSITGITPKTGDKTTVTCSSIEIPNPTCTLIYLYDDPSWTEASIYMDPQSDMDAWLCPYLQVLFKSKPEKLWVSIVPH
jgi:hypothetical protein